MADREKVITGLECCRMNGKGCRQCPYNKDCDEMPDFGNAHLCSNALELLREQPAKDTNVPSKWISVKDRLPDDASDVLAYYDDSTESQIIPVNYYKGCWYDCIFNRPIDGLETGFIRYWMSLPEPPEGGKPNENTL